MKFYGTCTFCEFCRTSIFMQRLKTYDHGPSCSEFLFFVSFVFIRPPVYGSNGRTYTRKMLVMFFLFFSTPNLRAPSANHRETSPHDRCLCLFYKLTTKIRGALPQQNWWPKTCKISVDFIQPPTLIANISGTA